MISFDEAKTLFPFLSNIAVGDEFGQPKVELAVLDRALRGYSLMENASEAAGHTNISQDLYLVESDGSLRSVAVQRVMERIYPPDYLASTGQPDDINGSSETVGDVLGRQDLGGVGFVVIHRYGDNPPRTCNSQPFNEIIVARLSGTE